MTKKKDKKVKIKQKDIPLHKAVYPLRVGTRVCAIIWDEETFIVGKIVKSYSSVEHDGDGVEKIIHGYLIETGNGDTFMVPEEWIYHSGFSLVDFIISEIDSHGGAEE